MRAWLEIDLAALAHNYDIVRAQIGKVGMMAVVKSDAYGHGLVEVAKVLDRKGVEAFAVISLEEAQTIRSVSDKPVLIMGYLETHEVLAAIEENFILSLYDKELAVLYQRAGEKLGRKVSVHLKVETGLNRLGLNLEQTIDLLRSQRIFPNIKIEALFSHLVSASKPEQNALQLAKIQEILRETQSQAELLPIHLASSYALPHFKEGYFDMVRVGLALYGVDNVLPDLKPILSCKSLIAQVKIIEAGEGVGYGHQFLATKQTQVAIVAMGYGEGYSGLLGNKAEALLQGRRVKIIGKISMNMMALDVTGLEVKRGDEVVLVGSQKGRDGAEERIAVTELSELAGIRHHEFLLHLAARLPRRYSN